MSSLINDAAQSSPLSIADFYAGRSVFITGATGFLGKVLVEKLLRACPDIANIYILVRDKRGVSVQDRLDTLLKSSLFNTLRKTHPDFGKKVIAVTGELTLPELGIQNDDLQRIIDNVSVIFHSAATIKFNEPLRVATEMNVKSVQKVINLCKDCKNLKAFVHVSTAYANCTQNYIDEIIYEAPIEPYKLIDAVDKMDDDLLDQVTPRLIKPRPNTYTFTKAVAERLIQLEGAELPTAIVRPSIVSATHDDPTPGWVDNFGGSSGPFTAVTLGQCWAMEVNETLNLDIVPVDMVINTLIAAGWKTGTDRSEMLRIYNFTSGERNPLCQYEIGEKVPKYGRMFPPESVTRVPPQHWYLTQNKPILLAIRFYEVNIRAKLLDGILKMFSQKPRFGLLQKRLWGSLDSLAFFTCGHWEWSGNGARQLEADMTSEDKDKFNIDITRLRWDTYLRNYMYGLKVYALKDDATKMTSSRQRLNRLRWVERFMQLAGALLFAHMLSRQVPRTWRKYLLLLPALRMLIKMVRVVQLWKNARISRQMMIA